MKRQLQGLIFDFDGLIVDTETARYYTWKQVIESHAVPLPPSLWLKNIGLPTEAFDPLDFLQQRAKKPIDRQALLRQKQQLFEERMKNESLRPGVLQYLTQATHRKIRLAVCSSSPANWVSDNLARFGVKTFFHTIVTGSDVANIKPHPEPYLTVLQRLNLPSTNCIAFEDSPTGVQSATTAGIFCVAVPNPITANSDLRAADLKLNSLADLPLDELQKIFLNTPPQ